MNILVISLIIQEVVNEFLWIFDGWDVSIESMQQTIFWWSRSRSRILTGFFRVSGCRQRDLLWFIISVCPYVCPWLCDYTDIVCKRIHISPVADLNCLPPSSRRRSEFYWNFYAVSFYWKSKNIMSLWHSVCLSVDCHSLPICLYTLHVQLLVS